MSSNEFDKPGPSVENAVAAIARAAASSKPAPTTASFTFICENEAFRDEGFVPSINASQYQRIKAILSEQGPTIVVPGKGL